MNQVDFRPPTCFLNEIKPNPPNRPLRLNQLSLNRPNKSVRVRHPCYAEGVREHEKDSTSLVVKTVPT